DEHRRRLGDPVAGGMTKLPIMTAYRQQALACAASLSDGPRRTSELRAIIPDAPRILLHNVYGWFFRVERGVYGLTPDGTTALTRWPQALEAGRPGGIAAIGRLLPASKYLPTGPANRSTVPGH